MVLQSWTVDWLPVCYMFIRVNNPLEKHICICKKIGMGEFEIFDQKVPLPGLIYALELTRS